MIESTQPETSAADASAAAGESESLKRLEEKKRPPSASAWLSILAAVLAVAAIALALYDFRQSKLLGSQQGKDEDVAKASNTPSQSQASEAEKPSQADSSQASATAANPSSPSSHRSPSARVRLLEEPLELPLEAMREEAQRVATRLEKQLPDKPESLHVAALFYAQTRQTAEAERRWRRCVQLAPQVEMYYLNLAALLMERGENEEAVKTLQQALDAGFASPALMHHWGLALSNAGRFAEAIPVIEKSLKKEPNNGAEWLMLGKAQLETGELEQAEKSLRKAIDFGNQTAGAYFALGTTYARLGNKDEAKEYLQKYQAARPTQANTTQARFEGLNIDEVRRTALLVFSEAANVYLRGDQTLEAERLLVRALAYDPKMLGAAQTLARLYFDQKMLPEERVVRERILTIDPYNFGNYVDCAKVYAQLDDMAAAEAVLKLAMTRRPEAVEPYATLAEFHLQARRLPEARWFAEQALELQPRAEGYRLLAAICQAQKDSLGYQQALAQAERLSKKSKP